MIRLLTVNDIDLFRDIRREASRLYPSAFVSIDEQLDKGDETFRRWLAGTIWGAFEDDKLVGTTGFYIPQDLRQQHRGTIFSVYVREICRGKGTGDALLKTALAYAETKVKQVHLSVLTTAIPAIKTYIRNGFVVYGTDPAVFKEGDIYVDEYLMVKDFKKIQNVAHPPSLT